MILVKQGSTVTVVSSFGASTVVHVLNMNYTQCTDGRSDTLLHMCSTELANRDIYDLKHE